MALIDALQEVGEFEVSKEVAVCGSILVYGAAHATVHSMGNCHRHMGHLTHCQRFQVCPVCTPYIMARRLEALEDVGISLAKNEGLRHYMIVLSLRHHRGADWKVLVRALRKMQAAVRRGHPWREVVVGFIRLMESTYRVKNGHHPHEHIILALRVSDGFVAEEFFDWIHQTCKRYARKSRRSCEFTGRWWSEIPSEGLAKAIKYLGRADKMGTSDVPDDACVARNPLAELSTSTKHQPVWCIPPRAYAEVWRGSHRMRWFGVGGVWKSPATTKTDSEIDAEREEMGSVIAHIPRAIWLSWSPTLRREVRVLVGDRSMGDLHVIDRIVAEGGVAGPPPIPNWGEEVH